MNWIDVVIIGLLLIFLLEGWRRSFFIETLNFLSFLLAFLLSLRFYNIVANILQNRFSFPHSLANLAGFVIVWFMVELTLFFLIQLVLPKLKPFVDIDNKLRPFSFIPSFLRGIIFISILLIIFSTFPIQPWLKSAVQGSVIGTYILNRTNQIEIPIKNIFGGFAQDTLTFFTVEPKSNESVDLGFKTNGFTLNANLENQMISLVNQERVKRGMPPLVFNNTLKEIARLHSADMFKRGYFSHYSSEGESVADRADSLGYFYIVIGENLAYAPDLEIAHQGLMNSPGHRANILSADYNKIGIGVMDSRTYGLMITQVFSN